MTSVFEILTGYGPLGCWVVFSIWQNNKREKQMNDERLRWNAERMRWLRTLGKKLSDNTIDETMRRDD